MEGSGSAVEDEPEVAGSGVEDVEDENQWCVVRGVPGSTPLTVIGPFASDDDALAWIAARTSEDVLPGYAQALVAPANS